MPKDIIFSIDKSTVSIDNPDGAFVLDSMHYTDIEDATEISTRAFNKMTTSIPTPFARLFLYEGAFKTLNDKENIDVDGMNPFKGKAFKGQTINHYVVADALDMLEFLFEYSNDPCLKVEKWTKDDLQLLKTENLIIDSTAKEVSLKEKHNLLYESIKGNTTDGILGNTFYIFKWCYMKDGVSLEEVIGATSPLTLLYSAPNWRTNKPQNFYGGKGNELFVKDLSTNLKPYSLIERSKVFRGYVYALLENYDLRNPFFNYIRLTRDNYETDLALRNDTFATFATNPLYQGVQDADGNVIKVKDVPLKGHNKGSLDEDCEFVIMPTVEKVLDEYDSNGTKVEISKTLPLVLSVRGIEGKENPHYWYETEFQKNSDNLQRPSTDVYFERSLPNVPGKVNYPNLRVEDFFEDKIVKVSYNLDSQHFITGMSGNCQYLLPLKSTYFKYFKPENLQSHLNITLQNDGSIKAILNIPVRGKKKEDGSFDGATVRLEKTYMNNIQTGVRQIVSANQFNLAIFPFYRLEEKDSIYNCYEVMLGHDGKAELRFYDKDINDFSETELKKYENDGRSSVKVDSVKRRTADNDPAFGITTTYYHLGNSLEDKSSKDGSFQFIKASFDNGVSGIIVPNWSVGKTKLSTNEYVVSVDFGTTNTHVSYAQIDNAQGVVDPLSISDLEYQRGSQLVTLSEYGSMGVFTQFEVYMQREFAPMEIRKDGKVEFPIRTLIYEKAEQKSLRDMFGDMNIAFTLNEDNSNGLKNGQLKSNIKWDNDPNAKNRLRVFFTETMWIVKNKMVEIGGNMDFKFIFTFPQSMSDPQQSVMIDEWNKARNAVRAGDPKLNNWNKTLKSISGRSLVPYEGLAPWYRSIPDFGTTKNFLNIDIGGGTFDVIAVQPTTTQICPGNSFSAQFAAFELWGEGQQKTAVPQNGFYNYYKTTQYCQIFMDEDKGFSNYYNPILSEDKKKGIRVPLPSEVIPYLFKHDDGESEFSTAIRENNRLRSLIVLHFSSIIYYVGRVLMLAEINCPSNMQFTGMGSLYINLITDSEDILTSMVKAILRYATSNSVEIPEDFHVSFDQSKHHPKKITAEGAIMMWNTTLKSALTPMVNSTEVMIYGFEGDEDDPVSLKENQLEGQKDAVMERMKHFLGVFENNDIISVLTSLGIPDMSHLNYSDIEDVLSDSFNLMSQKNSAYANGKVVSKEAIFFWPLKEGIHKLALDYAKYKN